MKQFIIRHVNKVYKVTAKDSVSAVVALIDTKLEDWGGRWQPSRSAKREFAQKMDEIDEFCRQNNIQQSSSSDSYYFNIRGQKYRVSNHSIENSNRKAYNYLGEKVREQYHPEGRKDDTIYIHAGKTRIIEIYNALKQGKKVDGNGRII